MSTFEDIEEIELTSVERFEENEDEVENGGAGDAAEENENDDSNKKPVKPKRVVRNPQPKLNAETLKGKRGLIALESYFERVKFKGHGQEEEDLSVILKTYEYWCHRLFPKYPFDECISKIESLGNKKPVVSYVKRLRADLPYDYGPEIINENNDSEDDVTNNQVDDDVTNNEVINNEFDHLLEAGEATETQAPAEVSEEQLERIRLNRERAEQIRREKLRREKKLSEIMLNEASGSRVMDSLSENGDTESMFEEAMSQLEPSNNPEELTYVSQVESHIDLDETRSSQLDAHNCEETDRVSGDEPGDLEKEPHTSQMEVQNYHDSQDVIPGPLTESSSKFLDEGITPSSKTDDESDV